MQDSAGNPKTDPLVFNLRTANPIVEQVRNQKSTASDLDMNEVFGKSSTGYFTNISKADTHVQLFDGSWVPQYENFDATMSVQDNAERLAQQQGAGDKWANGWTKFFGKTGTAVLGGTVGAVNGFKEFMNTGSIQAVYDNDFSRHLSDLDTKLTYNNPNYKSQEEQDMNFLQAMGTANWWADDLLGGLSFTVGTVISEGAWALATGGSSLATSGARVGANIAGRAALKKGIKSIIKPSFKKAAKKADDLGELAINANIRPTVTGGNIGGTIGELANTARFTITSAGWESSFEALSYLKEGMQSFDSNFYADNGRMPTFEERQEYIGRLYDGANTVFGGNMVLVGASNLAIIGKAFDIKMPGAFRSMDRAINRRLFGIGLDDTGQALIKATRAQKIAGGMYGWLRPAVMEGAVEEGGQSVLSSAISDYAYAPFNPEYVDGSLSMAEAFANSFEDTFTTKEGWREIWTGMVIGIIGDKGSNLIAGRGLKSGISQAREQAQSMADFNKNYSIDNLSESLFYANRVQDSNKDEGAGSPEVTALKRRAGILAQLTQAHNTGMYSDIVDDTVTGIGLLDANALSEELGITVEEANQMKQDAIAEYQSLAKEFSRNKKFVDYYFGDKIRGQKPTQSRLMKDAIAFIMTNGQESYNESRTVLEQLKQGLAKTIPGLDVNSTLSMFDNIAHMTDANRVEFNKVAEQLKEVLENIGVTTTEIANLAQKDVSTIDSNLLADEANILTEKLNNLESEKKRLEQEANRLASLSALNNPYYKEEDGVQYMRAEDIATLEENIKTIEQQINEASDNISNSESLVELLHGYQDHLLAYKEYAEVSTGIISGNLDLNSKKSLIGKIFGPREYNKQEERFVRAVLGRAGMNLDQYMQDMLGLTRVINQAKRATDVTEVKDEVTETTESTLQELINNSPYLREKFSGEDGPRKLQEAMFSQQLKVEFSNLIDKANGDKSFDGRYESIDDNTSLTSSEKARLKDLMEQFGAVAIGEGFQQTGVTLTDLLVQMNQGTIKAGEDTGTMTKADFSDMIGDQTEETTGARNEEIAEMSANVQVSKKGSTTVIHKLTLKGLLNKLGVYVVDDTTSPRSKRGVTTEDLSNDKGTKVRFSVGDSVINAKVNNRGAIELTSEKRGDNILGIISANSNLSVVKYAHGTNNKYSFMFENGRPMKTDFQLTPRYSEEAIYNAKGGDYVRFEVDINDPYNQSIQDLSFEEKVKLVKVYIVDSAGNVLGDLKALEDVYGMDNFNILREQAATVYENGGGFVGYEAPIKTVLLGMPNMTIDAEGNPQVATTTHESVVDWGYMQNGKFTLKNKTEPANIRRDFVQRIKGKSRVPVAVIRFGSQTMAIPVAVRGEASNRGNVHKEALELDNENTAKKVIDLNADLIARGSSDRFYFNSPTDQNVYKTDGSLTDRVMEAIDFLNKYQDTPDISTMSKENAMSQIDSPVNFDSKPFISPKVIMNLGKMSKVGERTPEVTAEVAATEKASKEAESVVEEEVVTEETANLEYKETRFGDNTLVNHVRRGTPFTYQGLDGYLDTDGQRLIFIAGNQEFDLGYAPDLTLQELKEMGLERTEAMSVEIKEDGVIVFDGVEYTQEPGVETIIEDGDERYVTLKAPNGNFVTFQGDKADAIVYNMKKQEFTDKNITDEQGREIAKQTREAKVTKRTRKTAPKAEDTDTKSSVVVTTTKKEAKEVVEELKPIDGTLEEVSVPSEGSANTEQQTDTNTQTDIERINKERAEYGLEPLKPTYRGTSLEEWENIKNGEVASSDNMQDATWVSDKKEYSEEYVKTGEGRVLIEFKPEAVDKSTVESGQENDNTGVRIGRGLRLEDVQKVTDSEGRVIYDAENTVAVKKGRKAKKAAPKGIDGVAKGTTVTHKGKNKKVKSVTKNADGTVKRIELEDGTRLASTTQPAEQTTNPVSVILNRLKLNNLATIVHEVATEQLNKLLGQRTNTPIRNQLPLMNKEDLGEAFATGTETVARRQGDKVYKTYSIDAASMYENEAEFVESMEALNAEFPETGTKIVGKTIDGEYVVEQNYIDGVAPTKETLDQAMRDKGFVYEEGTWKKNGMEFDDITPDNAYVTADGTVVVYDANVYRGEDFDARYQIAGLTPNREVQELFESNPELANKVYEAAGIPKLRLYRVYNPSAKGVVIEGQEKYTGQWFTTDLDYALSYVEKNKKVIKGQNVTDNKYDYSDLKVDVVELNPSEAKKYLLSQETILKEKLDVEPDNFIIPSTIKRSATINIGKEIGISNKIIKSFLPSEKDVFKKNIPLPTTSKFENLLQLEQQAQQLYSQYLEQNPNGSIEQFKEFVNNNNVNLHNIGEQNAGLTPNREVQGAQNLEQESKAFNEGVEAVAELANEYKKEFGIDSVRHNKVGKLFPAVSRMIAGAYEQAETGMTTEEVREAYKALEEETLQQYEFIVGKGLKVSRWTGEGEPYPNSKSMLKDVRENNHLYFLPNSEAFGKEGDEVAGRAGLSMTDVYLEDGYRMTLSEVFRVVHDYFGHGILGNQFGAIGEENATLQHLDLYSFEALPAVIFQTRGQNSWVNFSGVNNEALRKIREGSKTNNKNLLEEGQKEFVFAAPKDSILPRIFNFKTYETARRINEQEEIRKSEAYLDPRGKNEDTNIPELLSRNTSRNSGKLNGFSRRSLGVSKRLGGYDVEVIAEYEGNQEIESLIKNVFPGFKGTQKIYEISNGEVYREMMIEALETNKFKSSVTVHSAEDFSNMRLFVTEDGSTGITLTKDGFLGGAFGNPKANRPNNLAQLMLLGIKEGAITAEAFDTVLPNYYSKFGFKAVSRTAFNEEYRPLKENGALEDWNYDTYSKYNNGRPDVVFFIYDGGDRNSIQNRLGQFDSYSEYQKHFTEYYDKDSYDDAYRFMEVEAINKSNYQNTEDTSRSTQSTVVTDLSGNQTEVDSSSIVTYESEAGPIHYIVDSNGDMQMVRLGEELRPSPILSTEQELEQIKAQAIANGTFMKAPNGKDTNLNERQWLQVRSKSFMAWSKNWNNVLKDTNNEPKIFYHSSEVKGITEFKVFNSEDDFSKGGFFVTPKQGWDFNRTGVEYSLFVGENEDVIFDIENKEHVNKYVDYVYNTYKSNLGKITKKDIHKIIIFDGKNTSYSIFEDSYEKELNKYSKRYKDEPLFDEEGDFYKTKTSKEFAIEDLEKYFDKTNELSLVLNTLNDISRRHSLYKDYISIERNGDVFEKMGFRGAYVYESKIKNVHLYKADRIKSATDNVGTFSSESNDIRYQDKVTVKGAVTGSNEVFINTDLATPDTPIHEFSHLYNTWLQQNRPELWNKGKSLVEAELNKADSEIKDVIDYVRSTQPTLSGDALIDEILAELVGRRGQALIESKSTTGLAGWLKEVWAEIANMLGLSQMSAEQVSKLTIMEYADAMSIDLLSGRDLKKQKRFTVKPKVTSADTRVNRTTRPTNPATEQLFSENRKFSKAEAPTITTSTISEYNVFMTMEDKIKSVKLLEFNKNTGRGKVFVTFTNANIPSAQYSNVTFDRREISELGFEGALPEGVDMSESGPFTAYHFREAFINTDENNVKNYFTNLVENENIIKFADEITMYRFSDGQLRAPNGEFTDMDYNRPFTLTKEDRNSPKAIRKQNILNISETLTRESRTEQNRDC